MMTMMMISFFMTIDLFFENVSDAGKDLAERIVRSRNRNGCRDGGCSLTFVYPYDSYDNYNYNDTVY